MVMLAATAEPTTSLSGSLFRLILLISSFPLEGPFTYMNTKDLVREPPCYDSTLVPNVTRSLSRSLKPRIVNFVQD